MVHDLSAIASILPELQFVEIYVHGSAFLSIKAARSIWSFVRLSIMTKRILNITLQISSKVIALFLASRSTLRAQTLPASTCGICSLFE